MAITLAQNVPANNGDAAGTNGSVTISAATAGQLITVVAGFDLVSASITDPGGYTRIRGQDGVGRSVIILRKIAAGGETTIQFTHSSSRYNIEAMVFDGNSATPDDGNNGQSQGGVTSVVPGSVTPSETDTVFVGGVMMGGDNGGGEAINNSWTILDTATFVRFIAGYKIKTDAAAENPTFSWTTSRGVAVAQANFKKLAVVSSLPERGVPRAAPRGLIRGVA